MKTKLPAIAIGAVLFAVSAGCSQQTINSANKDVAHDTSAAEKSIDSEATKVKPQLSEIDLGARVTAAIAANANLPHGAIRVDASPSGVRLRGVVATQKEKHLAGAVAKQTVPAGDTVSNELTVKS